MKEISEPTLSGIVEHEVQLEGSNSSSGLVLEFGVASRLTGCVRLAYRDFLDLP